MKKRNMTARFKGTCRKCRKPILPGDSIVFFGKGNSVHLLCDDPEPGKAPEGVGGNETPGGINPPKPKPIPEGKRNTFDFPELKRIALEIFGGNLKSLPKNGSYADRIMNRPDTGFTGYSAMQAKDWLENGYRSETLEGLEDFAPPIREKRRFVYGEEGDEIDLSAAWSGEDNFMTHWTKREIIPGISMVFEMSFVSSTRAETIIAYERWLAKATEAIISAGIDPEISISFPGPLCGSDFSRNEQLESLVRVKRSNETVDIHQWSAMLSPAGYRTFGFLSRLMQGEERGGKVGQGLSYSHGRNEWRVFYDAENSEIRVQCPYTPHGFPEEEMTAQLKAAIETLKRGGN